MDTPWKYICYLITNTVNDKKYVGITGQKLSARWSNHVRNHRWSQKTSAIGLAVAKYGSDKFEVIELCRCRTMEDAHFVEIALIAQWGSYKPEGHGYNLTRGGEGAVGWKMSPEAVERMRRKMTGKKQPADVVEKRAAFHRGRKRSAEFCARMKARKCSDETRKRISEATKKFAAENPEFIREKMKSVWEGNRGRVRPQEERDRIRASHLGVPHTDERKANISKAKLAASARRKLEAQNKPGDNLSFCGIMGMGC